MNTNTVLVATDLYKSFGRREVLKGAKLTVSSGSCVGIIGGNGCGKTTLLSILAKTVRADKGQILMENENAAAYVPQENPLIEELTVRDNLLLWYKGNKKAMKEDLETGAAALLGVKPMIKRTVGELSGGMKKRISIACALANHARLLILDEPGAALDMECKADIRRYLKQYMERGGAVILTSHEIGELSVCTQMYVLKHGRLEPLEGHLSERELIFAMQ